MINVNEADLFAISHESKTSEDREDDESLDDDDGND